MTQLRKSVHQWLTGANVPTNYPELGLVGDKGETPSTGEAMAEAPAKSAAKADWVDYRKSQGYTDEDLKGLTKDELIDLPDEVEAGDDSDTES
jgi:hypothetical protein